MYSTKHIAARFVGYETERQESFGVVSPMVLKSLPHRGENAAMTSGISYDPDTLTLLQTVLDDTWADLTAVERALTTQDALAQRILVAAAGGERDPAILRARALTP